MAYQQIRLANATIVGKWSHDKARKRLIIVCHGYQGSSQDPTVIAITDGLNKLGHDTFTFNFSKNAGGFDVEHQVGDIAQIVQHFKDYKEIVLLAASFAALTATIATIQLPRVSGLVTLSGFFGQSDLGQNHRKTYLKFRAAALVVPTYRRILQYYKQALKPEDIDVPVLVIHSKIDAYVYIKQSQNFYRKLKAPKHFVTLQDANHGITSNSDRKIVIAEINKWLKAYK